MPEIRVIEPIILHQPKSFEYVPMPVLAVIPLINAIPLLRRSTIIQSTFKHMRAGPLLTYMRIKE